MWKSWLKFLNLYSKMFYRLILHCIWKRKIQSRTLLTVQKNIYCAIKYGFLKAYYGKMVKIIHKERKNSVGHAYEFLIFRCLLSESFPHVCLFSCFTLTDLLFSVYKGAYMVVHLWYVIHVHGLVFMYSTQQACAP